MNEQKVRVLMVSLIVVGIALVMCGIYLLAFTGTMTTKGISGILTISGLIAGGILISLPAKLYLSYQILKLKDERLRDKNEN